MFISIESISKKVILKPQFFWKFKLLILKKIHWSFRIEFRKQELQSFVLSILAFLNWWNTLYLSLLVISSWGPAFRLLQQLLSSYIRLRRGWVWGRQRCKLRICNDLRRTWWLYLPLDWVESPSHLWGGTHILS